MTNETDDSATSPITVMLGRLEKVTDRGGGQYSARCPAHEDRNPSLSIREIDDRVLLHCFAGCHSNEIVAAVELSLADLFNTSLTKDYVKPLAKQLRWNWRGLLQTVARVSLVGAIAAGEKSRSMGNANAPASITLSRLIGGRDHADINDFISRLENVEETRQDQWMANCPAHGGTNRKLAVKAGNPKPLVYCHSQGCS